MPLFFLWRTLGLVNTLHGLIIIYIALNAPFAIFLLRSYMVQIPADFEDAARVDGANEWQVFQRIIVPLSWPGLLTVGLVVGLSVWNEFLMATVFLTQQDLFTVVTSYYNFTYALQPRLGPYERGCRHDARSHPCYLPEPAAHLYQWVDAGRVKSVA